MSSRTGVCQHCKRNRVTQSRQLCNRCYRDQNVRHRYARHPTRRRDFDEPYRRAKIPALERRAARGQSLFADPAGESRESQREA